MNIEGVFSFVTNKMINRQGIMWNSYKSLLAVSQEYYCKDTCITHHYIINDFLINR